MRFEKISFWGVLCRGFVSHRACASRAGQHPHRTTTARHRRNCPPQPAWRAIKILQEGGLMGWMTFYKVAGRLAGIPKSGLHHSGHPLKCCRPTVLFSTLRAAKKHATPPLPIRKLGAKSHLFLLSGHPNSASKLLVLPLQNRCASRNEYNGMQWYAMVCNERNESEKALALFRSI